MRVIGRKFEKYNDEIDLLYKQLNNQTEVAEDIFIRHKLTGSVEGLRNYVHKRLKGKVIEDKLIKPEPDIKEKIKLQFKKKDVNTLDELSDLLDVGISRIRLAIDDMIAAGHTFKIEDNIVLFSKVIPKGEIRVLNVKKMSTGNYRFGVCGDNHLGSKYQRLDVLDALYDLYESEGIQVVYNTGNWIDGEARFNKHDLLEHGLDNQVNYFIKNYPQRKDIETYYITGDDHEGWYSQREGIDVGKYAFNKAQDAGRFDLHYLGHMEADVVLPAKNGKTTIRLLHPGGGSSYAISYTAQKIVESYTGGEKPDILCVGHYHKAEYCYVRGVHVVQTGTTEDQTPFMRKKRLAAHLGGWIIEFSVDDAGAITRFRQEFVPFYDNAYYQKWKFKW